MHTVSSLPQLVSTLKLHDDKHIQITAACFDTHCITIYFIQKSDTFNSPLTLTHNTSVTSFRNPTLILTHNILQYVKK